MRILYHHRTQGEEPESIHILAIIDALRKLGHEVLLVGLSKKEMSSAGSNVEILSKIKKILPSFLFELLQIAYNVISSYRLNAAVKKFNPDLIYERYALYNLSGVLISKFKNIPLILEVNTPYAYAWEKYYKLWFPWLARLFERGVLNSANRIVTVTDVQKDLLSNNYNIEPNNIVVCHNAIDPDDFLPSVSDRSERPNNELITVGFVGTMNRWQGIPTFKDVIPNVLNNSNKVRFLMVGDGEYRMELENYIREQGFGDRVEFTGRVAHALVPRYVNRMDITVLPNSNNYGSPMKVFEYMAMGKAIIAPKVPPVEEIIEPGVNGLITPPEDSEEITRNILCLVENSELRMRIGENGRDYVLENHTWQKNASKVLELYETLQVSGYSG